MKFCMPATLAVLLCACGESEPPPLLGYVEAEPVYIAAQSGGRLTELSVTRGENIEAGQRLFALDSELEQAQLSEAQARVAQAGAQVADLNSGQRADELAVVQASVAAAQAQAAQSSREAQRQDQMRTRGLVAKNASDAARAQRDTDAAQLKAMQARLRAAELAARDEQRNAAQANLKASEAAQAQRQWQSAQRTQSALHAATVEQIFYRPGEWVAAGAPVVKLIEAGAVKLRFYVPETRLKEFAPGKTLVVACDGCVSIKATVRYMAREAEFTPPVIYSRENRAKLVYLAEAQPDEKAAQTLHPGQPVDVRPVL